MTFDLAFALALAVKMAVTAGFVVGATFAAERAGPVVGGLISTLPISAGPAYVFLSLDHGTGFLADAALASFALNTATCAYVMVYIALAQRRPLIVSFAAAFVVWLALAKLVAMVPWTTAGAIVANAVVFGACVLAADRFRHIKMPILVSRWYDIPLRACLVAVLVATVVGLSTSLGPALTGIVATFPIVLSSLMLILHPRFGGPATAAVLANGILGLVGFTLFCLTLHLALKPLGFVAALLVALAVNVGCNFTFWRIRRRARA